jgi:hypothetical protein
MSGRGYPRLGLLEFGEKLIESGDLDPVYVALNGHNTDQHSWEDGARERFLVAYWCLYHAGAACYVAQHDANDFWGVLAQAARNTDPAPTGGRWPRGHERRHWRGRQAVDSLNELTTRYSYPEEMVRYVAGEGGSFAQVSARAQEHRGFGPWIAFKICDMLERCLGVPIEFGSDAAFNGIFKDPMEAAVQFWRVSQGFERRAAVYPKDVRATVRAVVEHVRAHFHNHREDFGAPPLADRPINVQEIETILCKWKSHMNGHYPLDNDTVEIKAGLREWMPHSPLASQFYDAMPGNGLSELAEGAR